MFFNRDPMIAAVASEPFDWFPPLRREEMIPVASDAPADDLLFEAI